MAALGHSQLATVQRYIHWAQNARQALSEQAASVAIAGLAISTGTRLTAVVDMQKGRPRP
jgi:hypothetical protein